MNTENKNSSKAASLRQKAEEQLKKKYSSSSKLVSESNALKIFQELQLYLVEMEMQNEELKHANERAEQANLLMMEHFSAGVVIYGPDTSLRFANKQAYLLLGLTLAKMKGKIAMDALWGFVHDDGTPFLLDEYPVNIVLSTKGKIHNLEASIMRPVTNDRVWVLVNAFPEFDTEGTLSQIIVTFIDISERKLAEIKLKESEAQFKEFFESAADAIFIAEIDTGIILDANQAASRLLLLPHDQITGLHQSQLHPIKNPQYDKDSFTYHKLKINGSLSFHPVEDKVVRSDGKEVAVEIFAAMINIKGKHCLMGTFRDITERKRVELALKESEEKFRSIMENSADAIFITDQYGRYIYTNKAVTAMLGYTAEEMKSKSIIDLAPKNRIPEFLEIFNRLQIERKVFVEFELLKKDGQNIFTDLNSVILPDDMVYGSCRDITERKQAEKALRESEVRLHTLVQNIPDLIWLKNRDGVYLACNNMFERFFGATEDEIVGKTDYDFIDKELADSFREHDRKAMAAGKPTSNEEWIAFADDGHQALLDTIKTPMYDTEGFLIGVLGIARDITQRIQAENEIKTLGNAIEQGPSSIVITNAEGDIEFVNLKFTELTQYQLEDVRGKHPRIFNPGHIPEKEFEELWEALAKGNNWKGEVQNRRKDCSYFWEEVTISAVKNLDGKVSNYILIKNDISEKKQMLDDLIVSKEKAEESDHLKSAFLANMSHELRTPMNSILGFSDLLRAKLNDPENIEMIDSIYKSGKRLMTTLNSILELSLLESTSVKVEYKLLNPIEYIQNVIAMYKDFATTKNLSLELIVKDDAIQVKADENLFQQVISTIVDNALKYTKKGGVIIEIDSCQKSGSIHFICNIKDSGIGILAEKHELILQRFRQGSEGINREFEGIGLGLTIASKIINLMDGCIDFESEAGIGSVFTIELPGEISEAKMNNQLAKDETKLPETRKSGRRIHLPKVLYVEDNDVNIRLVGCYLKDAYDYDHVTDGESAIVKVKEQHYDIILMDINLGNGIDGIETMNRIRKIKEYENIPIAAVTGFSMPEEIERIVAGGCSKVLTKPFEKKDIINLISSLLKNDGLLF